MKNKIIYKYIGKVIITFSILMIIPIIVCLIYKDDILPFLLPMLFSLLLGLLLNSIKATKIPLYAKDGFIIVSLSWIIISIIGGMPFYINGDAGIVSSFFEAVSSMTTTGATIFNNVEMLSRSILFWRSYMHLIGGMGVITFVMAIIPMSKNDKSMHLLNAEMPGTSTGKIIPNTKKSLIYLYLIYFSLGILETILLRIGKVSLFNSLLITMSTISTGGLTYLNNSLATLSLYNKYIVAIFMFLSGINFNIYLLIFLKKYKSFLKSEELKVYFCMAFFAIFFIFINTRYLFTDFNELLISSVFHTISIMTSTGFSVSNIDIFPSSCKIVFLILMLVSACSGSTCGGFKISRLIISLKTIRRDILKIIHPNSVHTIRYEGKRIDDNVVNSNSTFLFLYVILILLIMLIVSFDGFSLDTNINAVFSTFANTGLCFDISNFSIFSPLSKIVLSLGMLLGRLEIFPIVVLFSDLRK